MDFNWSSVLKERQVECMISGSGSDLTIIVGSEEKEFKVHRFIMALWSPTLKTEMMDLEIGKSELTFPEIVATSMEMFLKFAYTGEYAEETTTDFEASFELFKTAIYFQFIELAQICTEHLRPLLTTENVLMLFKKAMLVGHKPLIIHAINFINANGDAILESEQFKHLSLDCVFEIVQQDDLQTETELKVFNALYKWGEAEAKREHLDLKDPMQLRTLVDKPLKWIRFPLMSTDEYRNGVAPKGLLHSKEIDSLLTFFMTPTNQRSTLPEELFISRPRNLNQRSHLKVSIAGDPIIKTLFDVNPTTCNIIKLKSMLKDKFNYPICMAVLIENDVMDSLTAVTNSHTLSSYGVSQGSQIILNKTESENDKKFCPQCSDRPESYCRF